jgi:cystathionine beta-lyase/cystathionine gamma-synthase
MKEFFSKCAGIKREHFNAENKDHRMIRLYVGLEEAEYLIGDLERALEKM